MINVEESAKKLLPEMIKAVELLKGGEVAGFAAFLPGLVAAVKELQEEVLDLKRQTDLSTQYVLNQLRE